MTRPTLVAVPVLIAIWAGALAVVRVLMESGLVGEVLLMPTSPLSKKVVPLSVLVPVT